MANQTTKLPPQNIEAEQSLLGALLIDKDAIIKVAEMLTPTHFYRTEQHGRIYEAILELFEKREPIDVVTVTDKLKQKEAIDLAGGPAYLATLVNTVPTSAHIEHYARIIKEHAIRRNLISQSTRMIESAYDESIPIEQILENAEQSIFTISQASIKRDFVPLKDLLTVSFDRLDELQKSSGKLRGVPTGFKDLDNKLAGLQQSNLIIFAARPGQGKCLSFDSKIVHPETGELLTIEEYYKKKIIPIFTLNDNYKINPTNISNFVDDGFKDVYIVKTATGREIEVTITHPFLTIKGWKKLGQLSVGERIATPRKIPVFGNNNLEDAKVKIIAYLLSDGSLTGNAACFTNNNPKIVNDFTDSIEKFGNIKTSKFDSGGTRTPSYQVSKKKTDKQKITNYFSTQLKKLINEQQFTQLDLSKKIGVSSASVSFWTNGAVVPNPQTISLLCTCFKKSKNYFVPDNFSKFQAKNDLTLWLEELSLMGKNALEKEIPKIIFTLTKEKIVLFLNRLFACDGSVYFTNRGATISYASSSKELIFGVQHLLLRFGILSRVREKKIKYHGQIKNSFELEIRDCLDIITFCQEIGVFAKEDKVSKAYLLALKKQKQNNYTANTIPLEIWSEIIQEKGNISWRAIYQKIGLPLSHNFHVGKRSPKRSTLMKISQAIGSKRLEILANSDIFWDRIISIQPLGKKQVYDLTIPDTHNFIACDFFVHNTSFVLNVAEFVAVKLNLPVAMFSLEMSQEELVDRIIVSKSDVDAWKLKTGKLDEIDYEKISHAFGELAEAPFYIDDTPGLSLAEIRTKARRLQMEHGLKLLIIDYLQLIHGRNLENRVQEVSEISQGLKNLARELKIPVLAVSQLSRAVEQRGSRKPQLADLRESGCLTGDTLLMRADTGERVMIQDLVGKSRIPIFSLNSNLKLETKLISKVFSSGRKEVFKLTTRSGRTIKASANHPFFTIGGWKRLDELIVGMHLGVPRLLTPAIVNSALSANEIILLAHLLGDGCVLPRQPVHYTSADTENIQIVEETCQKLFGIKPRLIKQQNWYQLYLPSPYRLARGKHNPIIEWLQQLGLDPVRSFEKILPSALFNCSDKDIGLFLHHLWSTDGNISWRKNADRKSAVSIYYSTTSRILAEQLHHLLLRLGIISTLRVVPSKTIHQNYQIHIQGAEMQLRFCSMVGSYGLRGKIVPGIITVLKQIIQNPNLDIIPKQVWHTVIQEEKIAANIGWREVSQLMDTSYCGSTLFKSGLSRKRLGNLAGAMDSTVLKNLAKSDIYWDQLVEIISLGVEEVFDATVPETHNFVANDFVVHNSIEQDADVVMFIYREDPENMKDVTLAVEKHRNGPTGEIKLIFIPERVKFYGMEKTRTK